METKNSRKKSNTTLIVLGLLALAIVFIGGYYYVKNSNYETTNDAQIDGNIESVKSSVAGYIDEIRFEDNQLVQKGDTLVVLNTDELSEKVKIAEAELENAKANLNASQFKSLANQQNIHTYESDVKSNQQSIIAAKADYEKAQKSFDRVEKLLGIKGATQQQLEDATNQLQVSKADYQRAMNTQESSISTMKSQKTNFKSEDAQVLVSQTLIKQKEAELELAKQDLKHAYIIAPFSGITTKRAVQEGQYLSVGQTLCALISNHDVWVTANFKENQLKKIQIGQETEISIDALSGTSFHGIVASFAGATGAKFSLIPPDNATGNFTKIVQRVPVKIKFKEISPAVKDKLFPGMSVYVRVNTK